MRYGETGENDGNTELLVAFFFSFTSDIFRIAKSTIALIKVDTKRKTQ